MRNEKGQFISVATYAAKVRIKSKQWGNPEMTQEHLLVFDVANPCAASIITAIEEVAKRTEKNLTEYKVLSLQRL